MADEVPDVAQDDNQDADQNAAQDAEQEAAPDAQDSAPDAQDTAPDAEHAAPDVQKAEPEEVKAEKSAVSIAKPKKRPKVAWSDDLSHDSEEDRERERLAQLERELAETPVKPIYEPEELELLVGYIVKMTILYDLRPEDWTESTKKVIEEWFLEPKSLVLCIYFKGDKLKGGHEVPTIPVYDLSFFLRPPDYVFKVESFHDEIIFGTFRDSIESNVIQIMECVYAPYFFAVTAWPDSVKSEFCTHIHTFLAKLTDMYYKMLGLTVLYIPREGQNLSFEKASADRELVKRLEGVVVYWTHQIKSCLEDTAFVASQKELLCPSDEYDFWVYRHENLNALLHQLKNPAVKHITKILVTTHSTFIHQFQSLCEEIAQKVGEATSNIEYLQVIKQPCAVLECVVDPDEISKHVPNLINLFRFIWMESPTYNSETRITNLFKALSNQIIILCRNYIKLEDLFYGNTVKAIGEFSKCIDCCKKYREIYDVMVEAHNEEKPNSWELDTGAIFNYIDSFIQRCFDMLDVCNCMIIFGRSEEEPMKNLTTISWAHAVNNKTYLQATLASSVCMLEADIVMGAVIGKDGPPVPIMAHPPATTSDLTLAEFLETIAQHNLKQTNPVNKKGAKLDFKSIEAYEQSQELISKYQALPVWLNADILPGPVDATTKPLDPAKFLKLGSKHNCAVLSVGWTTSYGGNITEGEYTSEQIGTMLRIINENHINQTVTFPVRAGLAANSQPVILDLLRETSSLNSTMTVWSSEGDHVEVDRLRALILTVGLERTYLDVPQELAGKLHLPPPDAKAKN